VAEKAGKSAVKELRGFYADVPAETYAKLRALTRSPTAGSKSKSPALFVRLPIPTYERLRRMALARSSQHGAITSMQSVVIALVGAAALSDAPKTKRTMAQVVQDLINDAPIKMPKPLEQAAPTRKRAHR
jgi:hypothetical protein